MKPLLFLFPSILLAYSSPQDPDWANRFNSERKGDPCSNASVDPSYYRRDRRGLCVQYAEVAERAWRAHGMPGRAYILRLRSGRDGHRAFVVDDPANGRDIWVVNDYWCRQVERPHRGRWGIVRAISGRLGPQGGLGWGAEGPEHHGYSLYEVYEVLPEGGWRQLPAVDPVTPYREVVK